MEEYSYCSSFWKFVCHLYVLHHVGSRTPLAVWIPGSGRGTQILDTWSDMPEASTAVKNSAPACLLVDTELIVTPMIHGSTFELHESSPIVLGVCEGYARLTAVSEG